MLNQKKKFFVHYNLILIMRIEDPFYFSELKIKKKNFQEYMKDI